MVWGLAPELRFKPPEIQELVPVQETLKSPHIADLPPKTSEIRAYVHSQARKKGVNPVVALEIVKRESNFNLNAIGDGGVSCGLWQINTSVHKDITCEEAQDMEISTAWAMEHLIIEPEIWTTFKNCRRWYEDCAL